MDDKLPFVFSQMKYIHEAVPPGRTWTTVRDANYRPTEDYALISRQLHSKTGEFSVTIAGIDMTGTRAAAEFVCRPGSNEPGSETIALRVARKESAIALAFELY